MDKKLTVIEEVRAIKEKIAQKHNYELTKIVASLRLEQEVSGRRIIRKKEQMGENKGRRSLVSG